MSLTFGYCVEAPIEWPELLALAVELDRASRFDSLWISDALAPNGQLDDPRLDAWSVLAAIAQATSRLRLGVMVSGNAYRHPAVLAKMVTTVDHISGGRVELGVGAGWPGENRRFGIEFWKRRERAERLDEALRVVKALWVQPHPKFNGRYYRLDEPPYSPSNVQHPHPPILVGGGSDPLLRIIAEHADKACPMIDAAEAMAKVAAYCREAGRDPAEIHWTQETPLFLHDDPQVQRRAVEWAIERQGAKEDDVRRNGLFGSTADVAAGVRRLADAGFDEVIVFQLPRVHLKSLRRFSHDVIPAFR
jgi:alkanesulfonate monooxygenase SsuD/methylene tetrahydromethanopterin reductase-like flavin-dependent oxidoreductase (luciferase family)